MRRAAPSFPAIPGTPSTEITEAAAKYREIYAEWAPNEKVAMETRLRRQPGGETVLLRHEARGPQRGRRSPVHHCLHRGERRMLIGVADDAGMHSSQNEQDSRHYARAAKLPMLEPADSAEALAFTKLAYELSERFDTPVLLKMCTRVSHSQSVVETGERVEPAPVPYEKKPAKYIMMPGYAKLRPPGGGAAAGGAGGIRRDLPPEPGGGGRRPQNRHHHLLHQLPIRKRGVRRQVPGAQAGHDLAMPDRKIKEFAASVDLLTVVEELDGFIEDHCRALGLALAGKDYFSPIGELSQNLVAEKLGAAPDAGKALEENIPARPPVMCAGCPHRGLFYTLNKLKLAVLGDIGCYTLGAVAPLAAIDSTICMGASVSGIHGFLKASGGEMDGKTVAVIGDSTFMHSGVTGLINIAYNESNATVIILDNSITGMTGHQQNPTTGYNLKGDPCTKIDLESLCKAVGIRRVRVVDPYDLSQCESVIKEELAAPEASVVISRRPCALLKYVKHKAPLTVDTAKCVGCKACMKIGCPAISVRDGKAGVGRHPVRGLRRVPAAVQIRRPPGAGGGVRDADEKHHDCGRGRPGHPAGQQAAGPSAAGPGL